ncbi:MAG: metallophosphoesterase family protein [Candidatus Babeliales bacterium]
MLFFMIRILVVVAVGGVACAMENGESARLKRPVLERHDAMRGSFKQYLKLNNSSAIALEDGESARLKRPVLERHNAMGGSLEQYELRERARPEGTFWDWKRCTDALHGRDRSADPIVSWKNFDQVVSAFAKLQQAYMGDPSLWALTKRIGQAEHCDTSFFDVHAPYSHIIEGKKVAFRPFSEKLIVPVNAIVALRGDLHGDVHALMAQLVSLAEMGYLDPQDPFKIINKKFYMVFLGDYVDRGLYGIEVLYTLLRLKIANPEQVFLIRGNHEDVALNSAFLEHGFIHELCHKYGIDYYNQRQLTIARMYDLMSVVLYLGCQTGTFTSYLQCCHGGMESGYDPYDLLRCEKTRAFGWLGKMMQKAYLDTILSTSLLTDEDRQRLQHAPWFDYIPEAPGVPLALGFMWNDFSVAPGLLLRAVPGRGLEYGKKLTHALLETSSGEGHLIRGVMRAHQHSGLMMDKLLEHNGLYKLWQSDDKQKRCYVYDGIVCTFMVAPNTVNGIVSGFTYDTFALLKTASVFHAWYLEPIVNHAIAHPAAHRMLDAHV